MNEPENTKLKTTSCRAKYMKNFLGVDSPSSLTKIMKAAKVNSHGTRGKERILTPNDSRAILQHKKFHLNKLAKHIVFWVNKGGVGKSSLSKLVAIFLASLGFKILFIDADSQGNATDSFFLDEDSDYLIDDDTLVLYDILEGAANTKECILEVGPNIDLLPSTLNNQNINTEQIHKYSKNSTLVFKKIIKEVSNDYDYIITDCGPNLSLLNCSISCSADMNFMLAHPHKFSKKGIQITNETMDDLEQSFQIKIPRRIIFNRYAKKNNLTHKVLSEIISEWPKLVLPMIISEKQEIANVIEYNHNFFAKQKFTIIDDLGNPKAIEYKDSPQEIASLSEAILNLPELTLNPKKLVQQ